MSTPSSQQPSPSKRRRTYTKDYKLQAVALVQRPGMSFGKAATDLGINESMLRAWAHQGDAQGRVAFRGHGVRTEQDARMAALERENRVLREEREI